MKIRINQLKKTSQKKKITKKKQKDYKKETKGRQQKGPNGFNKKSEDKVPTGITTIGTILTTAAAYKMSKKK